MLLRAVATALWACLFILTASHWCTLYRHAQTIVVKACAVNQTCHTPEFIDKGGHDRTVHDWCERAWHEARISPELYAMFGLAGDMLAVCVELAQALGIVAGCVAYAVVYLVWHFHVPLALVGGVAWFARRRTRLVVNLEVGPQ